MEEIINIDVNKRENLLDLEKDNNLGKGVSVVYIYYLKNTKITYPSRNSKILYIGEAHRDKKPTGVRFSQHISTKIHKGGDTGTNLILSQYFYHEHKIGLKIFKTKPKTKVRKKTELNLIYAHIKKFGSPPIAQGKIPNSPKTKKK